jgi:hypothetical protein
MHRLVEVSKQTHVRAVFADSVTFFDLPTNVTLEDLSERLSRLGEHHAGGLISLDVRTSSQGRWMPTSVGPKRAQRNVVSP